ncbi:MAG: anthranilate synthase component I, partial [Burkholderiales bacterium]|nr:anthranilate synthase component I [Burkholderiales bacterium]
MTESQFNQLAAEGYNRIPLVLETFADLDTPLSVYLKLANRPYTYLLESIVGGERFGRYSFIGLGSETRLEVRGNECSEFERGELTRRTQAADPLQFIQQYQSRFKAA